MKIELNEITANLPPHLLQFVIEQPYNEYTPIDQAIWRYVMRKNYDYLSKVAHESYCKGLTITGIEIDSIPTMYGMNRILKQIGWAAVSVDGFIPPSAFMEFQAYKVLVIAADIRTLEHIEYTPAPDKIHEAAGHAPILADKEYALFLQEFGKIASKAFSSAKDYELYEAIRHLSIIKEDTLTLEKEVEEAELRIANLQLNMGVPSEMSLLRNFHWWTVEYGLIGNLENYKIYGAGLLSSIGESKSCMNKNVPKYMLSKEAMFTSFDITKPQKQLFITPDFVYLKQLLHEFSLSMALMNGGLDGIQKAIDSSEIATIVYSSGLQVSGFFVEVKCDNHNVPVFIKTKGATCLSIHNKVIDGQSTENHPFGFSSPIGKLENSSKLLEDFTTNDLIAFGIIENTIVNLQFSSKISVNGLVKSITRSETGKIIIITFFYCTIKYNEEILADKSIGLYDMAIGETIISAFHGATDASVFQEINEVPKEKTHKPFYDESSKRKHFYYEKVRSFRVLENKNESDFTIIFDTIVKEYATEWLLLLELLEIAENNNFQNKHFLREFLNLKSINEPNLSNLINDGIELIDKQNIK